MLCSLKNRDLFTTLVILAVARVVIEFGWLYLTNTVESKIALYTVMLLIPAFLLYDKLSKIFLLVLITIVISEVYWWSLDYPAPEVYWSVLQSLVVLLYRHVFMFRAAWLRVKFKSNAFQSTDLDFFIYIIGTVQFVIYTLFNLEYLFRHILNINFTLIYTLTPNLIHALNILLFVLLFSSAIKEVNRHLFNA